MSNELVRWSGGGGLRQRDKELARLDRQEAYAAARVATVTRVTGLAILSGACVTKLRNMAELYAPDVAEKAALYDMASAIVTVGIIQDARKW